MSQAYYDTNYLFKLQCVENGTVEVRAHAATVNIIYTAAHGRAEFASAAFRKVREGSATPSDFCLAIAQVKADAATGNLRFLPLTEPILDRVEQVFSTAPATTYLRAADAFTSLPQPRPDSLRSIPTTNTSSLLPRSLVWSV